MAVVNISAISCLLLVLLLSSELAPAIWIPEPRLPQRSTPRALPYQSLKGELSLSVSNTFPSHSPSPDETIGAYFDTTLENLSQNGSLTTSIDKRNLVRTSTHLESLWYDGKIHFNVSIMKCITFDTIAGPWTLTDGTVKENATLLDINKDLQAVSDGDAEEQYGSRVLDNANIFLNQSEQYMKSAICHYDSTANPMNDEIHDELRRKLLGVDGYWIATIFKSMTSSTIAAGVYAGFFNPHNHTTSQVVAAGIAGGGVTFMIAVIDRLQLSGRLSATEASILSVLISWYNQALHAMSSRQIGPDNAVSGPNPCISKEVVEDAMKTLANFYDVETGFYSGDPLLDAMLQCDKNN